MPLIAKMTDELHEYLRTREALTALEMHLDDSTQLAELLDAGDLSSDRANDVVDTLCHQARAAQQLARAAEALCAALVGGSHYCGD